VGGSDNLQQGTRKGRVEICINNAWGTVCHTAFGIPDAQVACYELGGFHREGAAVLSSISASGSGPIFLDQLDCNGTENTLLECNAFTGRGLSTCDHSQDVGVRCRDISECDTRNGGCEQMCTNTIGSFNCSCGTGYLLDGNGLNCTGECLCLGTWMTWSERMIDNIYAMVCFHVDINECESNTDNCNENADCTNTEGSFTCSCNPGYTGDGVSCTNINECELGTPCDPNANCTDTVGSFDCLCNAGYTGNGLVCINIDECEMGTDNCDENADCTDTIGSFSCACNSGYSGDGVNCLSEFLFNLKVHYVLLMVLF